MHLVRLTHWRQHAIVGAVWLQAYSLLNIGYCLNPDIFVYFSHCYKMVPSALWQGLLLLTGQKKIIVLLF